MQFLQLGLIFIILIALTIIVFEVLAFLMPIIVWLLGVLFIGAVIIVFGMLFYNLLKQ